MLSVSNFNKKPYALLLQKLAQLFPYAKNKPPKPTKIKLNNWTMEEHDAPIFEYLFKVMKPLRDLEFGHWQEGGTTLCLKSCNATVWTIYLLEDEDKEDGNWAHDERVFNPEFPSKDVVSASFGEDKLGPRIYHRTDARGYIGRIYREKGLGNRGTWL